MSELKVNKISPRSGTDVTLGDSGDTFTIPAGATLDTSGATLTLPTTIEVDTIEPQSGTTLTLGASGDTITIPSGATFSATITAPVIDEINDTNGNEEIIFTTTTSAVNELTIANAATGNAPEISATGDDTDINLRLNTKGTGGVVFNAGAVATPSITTTGDTNTGIFFPSADTIAFTEGGTEAMRIDSSGNVGINNISPSVTLDVAGIIYASSRVAKNVQAWSTFTTSPETLTNLVLDGSYSTYLFTIIGTSDDTLVENKGLYFLTRTGTGYSFATIQNSGGGTLSHSSGTLTFASPTSVFRTWRASLIRLH